MNFIFFDLLDWIRICSVVSKMDWCWKVAGWSAWPIHHHTHTQSNNIPISPRRRKIKIRKPKCVRLIWPQINHKNQNTMKEFSFTALNSNKYCLTVLRTTKSGVICNVKDGFGKTFKDVFVSNKNFVECIATENVYKVELVEKPLKGINYFMDVYTIQLSRNTPCQF